LLQCFHCGSPLDAALSECPACGAEIEVSRLTGVLGSVCRGCDAFNEPGSSICVSCGQPLLAGAPIPMVEADLLDSEPDVGAPSLHELPPIDFEAVLVPEPEPGPWLAADPLDPIDLVDPVATPTPRDALAQPLAAARPAPLPFESLELEPDPATTSLPLSGSAGPCQVQVERGDTLEGSTFPVGSEEVSVGSSEGTIAFSSDPSLAPRHATFFVRGGRMHVRDEGSSGGTFLRLRGLTVPLRPGDAFAVGDRLLRFGGPLPAAAPPAPDGTRRLGSPRPTGHAVLLEERLAGGVTGRVWLRAGSSVSLGRAGCSVNLGDDPFLSQAHAEVILEGDGTARLRDLGSANGTFLRLPPRSERELQDGDLVRVGRQVLRVSVPSERGT
jgi:pSer/pThr/pTyr-binding forkhead associated (FHA) protein